MLSSSNSERGPRAAAAAGAGAGAAAGGMLGRSYHNGSTEFDTGARPEKSSAWLAGRKESSKKKRKWAIILLIFAVVAGALIGGIVGGVLNNGGGGGGGGGDGKGNSNSNGQSAQDDAKENGDLSITSSEIKDLMNNPDLHRVFPGMDYTPLNTQYPDCKKNPPSQNNVTRDVAVLSQLTNKIRLYGTDCNQTQMVIHAIDKLEMKDDIKIWLGVWQDDNASTNKRQLDQMWDILEKYGDKYFEGIILANEILFREQMTVQELGDIMNQTRERMANEGINLPVATSDLGDDWTPELGLQSDYIMANIHPFFSGTEAPDAANWTLNFWDKVNSPIWKSDNSKNIISETGWPTSGGRSCGEATTCDVGSVAGIDELNTFMADWVCQALDDKTNYFWFSAFDEPWKIRYNEKGKEWEDKWGLMDVDRNLKSGVKIPDCGGRNVADVFA
jgi:exo-beta-1,3-glucanase (GH17 family)